MDTDANEMKTQDLHQFRVVIQRDLTTDQTIAHIPTLDIADFGIDSYEALARLQEMLVFHLECLVSEGKSVPRDDYEEEGFYLRVRLPVGAS